MCVFAYGVCVFASECLCVREYVCACLCVQMCVFAAVFVYICVCVCLREFLCVHILASNVRKKQGRFCYRFVSISVCHTWTQCVVYRNHAAANRLCLNERRMPMSMSVAAVFK